MEKKEEDDNFKAIVGICFLVVFFWLLALSIRAGAIDLF